MTDFRRNMREKATPDNFVWIPAGSIGGEESGIIGYWDGTKEKDLSGTERAKVECIVNDGFAFVKANLQQLFLASNKDIEAELTTDEIHRWRDVRSK